LLCGAGGSLHQQLFAVQLLQGVFGSAAPIGLAVFSRQQFPQPATVDLLPR
jgi:hypothetical protein